jgi:hypothetical protein
MTIFPSAKRAQMLNDCSNRQIKAKAHYLSILFLPVGMLISSSVIRSARFSQSATHERARGHSIRVHMPVTQIEFRHEREKSGCDLEYRRVCRERRITAVFAEMNAKSWGVSSRFYSMTA